MIRTVLVVDDVPINRQLLKSLLIRDYDILEAENGAVALDILRREGNKIAAVLLDVVMPVMDGYTLLAHMQEDAELSSIPVIVLTGSEDESTRVKALSKGASDFATKPYNPDIIRHCLKNNIALKETASLVSMIQRDSLTGMYNRTTFFAKVAEMVKQHEPGYYIMACFDIDNFKVINDQFGTDAGDAVLKLIGTMVLGDMSELGGICCRINADNFAVLTPAKSILDGEDFIPRAKERISGFNSHLSVTFTAGRYIVNDLTLTPSSMYDRAYIAKQSIKGRYDEKMAYFDESMRESLLREQLIIDNMDAALKNGQFEAWFQPQINHATGALIGAEALARWRHPKLGLISPAEFVPIFERNGFIYELDKCIWEQTCANLRRWIDEGQNPMPVSVNISRYDIFRADLVSVIVGMVKQYDLPTSMLRLEVTESAFSSSTARIVEIVKKLIAEGFTVEIDDFGSGYSSLNTLKNVPAQIVKLDMRFLEDDDGSNRGGNVLESVVHMVRWLGMSVIAEGVEDVSQADYLKSIGCNYIQGYLYSKPLPLKEYEDFCRNASKEERMRTLKTVKNLDNNAFWNPKSMDTLIFNSYVGGACIFQYFNHRIEFIRFNDNYVKEIGIKYGAGEDTISDLNPFNYMSNEEFAMVSACADKAIETNAEQPFDVMLYDGGVRFDRPQYLKCSLRVIAKAGSDILFYCVVDNITEQKDAERKKLEASAQMKAVVENVDSGITASVADHGEITMLMSNDEYFDILGYTREQYDAEVSDLFDLVYYEDREFVKDTVRKAYETKTSERLEYRVIRRDGAMRWLRVQLSSTQFSDVDKNVQLAVFSDITEEKELDEQLSFLNDMAHDLLSEEDGEKGINNTLKRLMNYFMGARAYIFEFDFVQKFAMNTYEVCAEGVTPEIDSLQNVPIELTNFWLKAFETQKYYVIEDVDALDDSRAAERERLEAQNIKSLFVVPLLRNGEVFGMIGVDDPKKALEKTEHLLTIGDYIAVLLTRRDLSKKIKRDNETLESLLNDMPGGFVRLKLCPDGTLVSVYVNDGFLKLVSLTREELHVMYDGDIYAGVHREDLAQLKGAVKTIIAKGEVRSSRYRIRSGKNSYKWVSCFGRMTRGDSGEYFLNLFYSDASDEQREENIVKELLDNLPHGAALYEYDGKRLSVIHLNKRYWEMVGREPVDYSTSSVLDVVYPDDRKVILDAVVETSKTNTQLYIDVRILCGDGEYHPFHIAGRTITKGKKYSIYATYTPISTETMNYREMIPVVLSAIMGSTSDLTFAKDKSFKYICASNAFAELVGLEKGEDVVGKTDYDLFSKQIADKYRKDDEMLFESGKSIVDMVEQIPSDDAVPHYSNTSKYLLKDESGKAIGLYGVGRDITKYRDAFEKLKLLTDSIPGGLASFEISSEGIRTLYFSDGFFVHTGYNRAEYQKIMDNDPLELIVKEDRLKLFDAIEKLKTTPGVIGSCNYRCVRKDGDICWLGMKGSISEVRGDRAVVNVVQFDISDQMREQERLLLKKQYEMTLDSMPDFVAKWEFKDGDVLLVDANQKYLDFMHATAETAYGKSIVYGLKETEKKELIEMLYEREKTKSPVSFTNKLCKANGEECFVKVNASFFEKQDGYSVYYGTLTDVTELVVAQRELRISEEANRLALQHSGNVITRFLIEERTLVMSSETAEKFGMPERFEGVPYEAVRRGYVSQDSAKAYIDFFKEIIAGGTDGESYYQFKTAQGWCWQEARYSTVFDEDGKPLFAVVSFFDVTERLEKEAVYKKWQQSLEERASESYTLFRCNLSKDATFDTMEGSLLKIRLENNMTFNERTLDYASQYVFKEDRDKYVALLNSDTLLANYFRGKRSEVLEYRELLPNGSTRWLQLTIELVEYPNSTDIEAYMMYENIDEHKREELQIKEQAETDPLTGLLNRKAFSERMDYVMATHKKNSLHALLMLDLDCFKLINDTFGHAVGDETLLEVAEKLKKIVRNDDIVGRLGGDEFVVCLCNVAGRAAVGKKAQQICSTLHKAYNKNINLSASIGIAMYPEDGDSFEKLYLKADRALYQVKETTKDDYAFYTSPRN